MTRFRSCSARRAATRRSRRPRRPLTGGRQRARPRRRGVNLSDTDRAVPRSSNVLRHPKFPTAKAVVKARDLPDDLLSLRPSPPRGRPRPCAIYHKEHFTQSVPSRNTRVRRGGSHPCPARPPPPSGLRGRPPTISEYALERIKRERAAGKSLAAIANGLNADRIPTAQGGRRWYPATVSYTLKRTG